MKSAFAFILCIWLAQCAQAQLVSLGTCPKVNPVKNFKISEYFGTWYKYSSYFFLPEAGAKCLSTVFGQSKTAGVYDMNTVGTRAGSKVSIPSTAKPASTDNSGLFSIKFDFSPINYPTTIVAADRKSYAIVWSCIETGVGHSQQAWILTKDRKPSQKVIDTAYAAMTKANLSTANLSVIDQSNC